MVNFFEAFLKNIVIIALGIGVFYFDQLEFVDSVLSKSILLLICLFKCGIFVIQSYKKIIESTEKGIPYHHFLAFMGVNVCIVILSFAVDNYCLYRIEPSSFSGLKEMPNYFYIIYEFLFYSTLGFTNFGFGVLTPETLTAKTLITLEIIISFVAIIFILSDFISLRESIVESKIKKQNKNN